MQVYRGMNIGTAKPSADLRGQLPHHLLDILSPSEQFTAGDFVRLADEACAGIAGRGRLPIVSGGTAFYLKNFVCGLPQSPAVDLGVREALARDLREKGPEVLRAELLAGDPESAARIHSSDLYRLTRALEVLRQTGKPLSACAVPHAPRSCYDFLLIALERPRDELYARIDQRVDVMFSEGLVAEVQTLLGAGASETDPGMQAIGYREFLEAKRTGCMKLRDIRDAIAQDSRRYAKRQLVFFRSMPGVEWFSADDFEGIRTRICEWWGENRPSS